MNLKQWLVVFAGALICIPCLLTLAIPRPGQQSAEGHFRFGRNAELWATPAELTAFAVLLIIIPLTVGAIFALKDKREL